VCGTWFSQVLRDQHTSRRCCGWLLGQLAIAPLVLPSARLCAAAHAAGSVNACNEGDAVAGMRNHGVCWSGIVISTAAVSQRAVVVRLAHSQLVLCGLQCYLRVVLCAWADMLLLVQAP
jgi:hypothetical protein